MITAHDLTPAVTLAGQAAMAAALADFKRRYPAYARTAVLDDMRARDYTRLDATGHVYLDYTGGGLYADSQLARHRDLLARAVFGNPHSQNLPSREATALVEATRAQILEFFRASPEEYEVIFTPNATGALRLVGESYPFGPGSRYLLTFDNHNSVNGIRQFARAKGASVSYVPLAPADLRVSEETLARHLAAAAPVRRRLAAAAPASPPATCSPSRPSPTSPASSTPWPGSPRPRRPATTCCWTPPLSPANRLDLSRWHPDYVSLSFYKIFGYPTGIGALLVRRPALARLHRPWYAGGTITFSSVRAEATPGGGFYLTRAGRLRGRDRRLPGHPGRRHRPGPHRLGGHRDRPHQGHVPDRLAAGSARRPAAQQRGARRPPLRPGRYRPPRSDDRDELLRSRRRAHRFGAGRAPGQHGGNLPAQRLPLQPRRAGGRARLLRQGDGGRLQGQGPAALPGVPPGDRREDHRGGAGLARPGHHLRRRLPVLGVRRRASATSPPTRWGPELPRPGTGGFRHGHRRPAGITVRAGTRSSAPASSPMPTASPTPMAASQIAGAIWRPTAGNVTTVRESTTSGESPAMTPAQAGWAAACAGVTSVQVGPKTGHLRPSARTRATKVRNTRQLPFRDSTLAAIPPRRSRSRQSRTRLFPAARDHGFPQLSNSMSRQERCIPIG